jgi:hypothetical protein
MPLFQVHVEFLFLTEFMIMFHPVLVPAPLHNYSSQGIVSMECLLNEFLPWHSIENDDAINMVAATIIDGFDHITNAPGVSSFFLSYRPVPGDLYRDKRGADPDAACNELVIRIQPKEAIYLKINNKVCSHHHLLLLQQQQLPVPAA